MNIGIALSRCHRFGSSRYVLETSEYFTKKGNNVHIFAHTCDPLINPKMFFHPIPTFYSKYNPRFFFKFLARELSLSAFHTINMKRFSKALDVTLAQPTRYFSPMVGELQFVYGEWIRYKIKNKLPLVVSDNFLLTMERMNVKKAKKLIAIADSVKKELISHYHVPADKIAVAHSGVNTNEFNPDLRKKFGHQVRKQFGISDDELLLLFAGNPFDRKGLDVVIKSLPLLKEKNFKLVVVGKDVTEPYKKLASSLGVGDKVVFTIEKLKELVPDVGKIYAACDIFVLPTLYEPFGLVVSEAMACGLPPVISKLAGAAELIDDGKDGIHLKDPKNFQVLAEELNYLMLNDSARKQMGKKAREKAEKYTWERAAKIMLEAFEEVYLR